MRKLFFGLLLILLYTQAWAQDWRALYQVAQQLEADGEYEKAYESALLSLSNYQEQDGQVSDNYIAITRQLSTVCFNANKFEEGIKFTLQELALRQQLGKTNELPYATTLYNLASFYQILEDWPKAEENFTEAGLIYSKYLVANEEELIFNQWKLAASKTKIGKPGEANRLFIEAFNAYGNRAEISTDYLIACYEYGSLLIDIGQASRAIPFFKNVSSIYVDSDLAETRENALVQEQLAFCFQQNQELDQANAAYSEAIRIYTALDESNSEAAQMVLNKQAINFQMMGKGAEAEAILAQAKAGISTLNYLAAYHQNNDNFQKAESYYRQALATEDGKALQYAEVAENLAGLYINNRQLEKADSLLNYAEELVVSVYGNNHERYAITLQKKAQLKRSQNQFDASFALYEQAGAIIRANGADQSLAYANLLNGWGIWYQEKGDYGQAEKLFNQALSLTAQLAGEQHPSMSPILNNLATTKEQQANYLQARLLLDQARNITRQTSGESSAAFANISENLGLILLSLGDYQEAENLLQFTLDRRKTIYGVKHPLYANSLINLARIKQAEGKYNEAEPLFMEGSQIIKSSAGDSSPDYAGSLNALAILYQTMGNFPEAEPLFVQAGAIYEKNFGKIHIEYATTLENLATLNQIIGNTEKAEKLLKEAIEIDKIVLGQEHPNYAVSLHNLASIYQGQKNYAKAEPLYQEALGIYKKILGPEHPSYAGTLYNLAVLYQDQEKYPESEKAFLETLDIRQRKLGTAHPDYLYTEYGLAVLYHRLERWAEARKYYQHLTNGYLFQIESFFPSLSEKEKSAFYAKIKPIFEAFQDFAVEFHTKVDTSSITRELYNVQLSTKALLLNASNKVRDRILNSNDAALIQLYTDWINQKERLVKYYGYSLEDLQNENIDLAAAEAKSNALEKKLSEQSSIFSSAFDREQYTWLDVQQALKPQEAALEIIRIKKKFILDSVMYVALIVDANTRQQPGLIVMSRGDQLENRLYKYYRNSIRYKEDDPLSYTNFWGDINKKLQNIEKVYVSADGIYNKININTLWDPSKPQYLIEEYDIRIVSNTREILEFKTLAMPKNPVAEIVGFPDFNLNYQATASTQPSRERLTRASAFGEFSKGITPLPGTKVEIETLENLLSKSSWRANIYKADHANESRIKQLQSPYVLHIATHGFFLSDLVMNDDGMGFGIDKKSEATNPLFRSGLLLAGSGKSIFAGAEKGEEDGILTAYEAMNLSLDNTELIVMSACETGLGEVKNGEGVYGLQRAFIVAGARSLVMSLWKVDDETTQQLMTSFYTKWLEGGNKFQAFKEAQIELKKVYPDPYHWGAFVMLGQ